MRWVGVLAVCVVLEGKSEFGWDNSVRGEERGCVVIMWQQVELIELMS